MPKYALVAGILSLVCHPSGGFAQDADLPASYRENILPILDEYCYRCHGEGQKEGGLTLDAFQSQADLVGSRDLWWRVLKKVRADLMPPHREPAPSDQQRRELIQWIKSAVFQIDPTNPDPGRVTLRRLNRVEYRNTIRDLMGMDFNTDIEFPPDDTGFGFDNIGDVLSTSPLLLEKYLDAAETIVDQAVPRSDLVIPEQTIPGGSFQGAESFTAQQPISLYSHAAASHRLEVAQRGEYQVVLDAHVQGGFDFDPGRCDLKLYVDGDCRIQQEIGWNESEKYSYEAPVKWEAGEHILQFELNPLVPVEQKRWDPKLQLVSVRVKGPKDTKYWVRPKNFDRFFPDGPAPESVPARDQYCRRILTQFVRRAFRRPATEPVLDDLVQIARSVYAEGQGSFYEGVAQAVMAVLASPRFLFRFEATAPRAGGPYAPVDEFSLATRLSYFLWSTMPDDELLDLAEHGELRHKLRDQVTRMLQDKRAAQFFSNFTGQWLLGRDVETSAVDPIVVLGYQDELEKFTQEVKRLTDQGVAIGDIIDKLRDQFLKLEMVRVKAASVQSAMRVETEMLFGYVVRNDRPALELLDCDYTFLNQQLAEHYGIPGVTGEQMRKVQLPEASPRGGLLTQGTILVATSNPTRTSPVKRGQFILDSILGTPSPPPPGNVPALSEAAKEFKDSEPTLRQVLELHRSQPICKSCHAQMDPLGLALENFNALGIWRDKENDKPIDTSGRLITGESFGTVADLKKILTTSRRLDFYRCLTEKLLTYATGRGLDYYDEHTVDQIVDQLDHGDGGMSIMLMGIIDSAPFQKIRLASLSGTAPAATVETLSATLDIDADAQPLKYDRMIFGGFIEHFHRQIYGGIFDPGSPLSDENGFRKDVIEALKELRMPIVRWPGGCFASAYHWLDGVGPKRTPAFDKAWRVEDPNTFGTDEFVKWCRAVGTEPYICVNAGTGTIEEMSDWVEYCNQTLGKWAALRKANGYPEPYGVRYWSIGNENYGPWEPASRTAEEWPMLVREAAQLMEAVDPSIKVLAPVVAQENWAIPTLKVAGRRLDYISIHEYYDALWEQPVASDYLTCMSWADRPEQHIIRTIALLDMARVEHVRIAFDEWNLRSWHHPNTPGERASAEDIAARDVADRNSTYTMADALFSAGFYNACLRHPDRVTMANIAPIVNTRGPIYVYPGGIVKRTTFHVMRMYANELEQNVVPLKLKSDTLPEPADKVSAVDALATCDDSKSKWRIVLLNRHPEHIANVNLNIAGRGVSGTFPATVLSGDHFDAFNDIEQPERVTPQSVEIRFQEGRAALPPHSLLIVSVEQP